MTLPGYWAFTFYVLSVIKAHWRIFVGIFVFYGLANALFVGLSSQGSYSQLSALLDKTGDSIFTGGWGSIGRAGLLLLSGISGSLAPQLTDVQQVFSSIILLLTWLTTVWLLRSILAGKNPRLRDGLYNGGAPIVATAIVLMVAVIQLLPATIAIIAFSSAMTTNLFDTGIIAMLITLVAALLVVLSLYWIVATIMALIVVTLPGMYPWQALRAAGDMVVGRRVRLLLRMGWMTLGGLLSWVLVVLPTILIVRGLTRLLPLLASVPIIPIVIAAASSAVIVWSATYMYLLYRKVVEDDAKPA